MCEVLFEIRNWLVSGLLGLQSLAGGTNAAIFWNPAITSASISATAGHRGRRS